MRQSIALCFIAAVLLAYVQNVRIASLEHQVVNSLLQLLLNTNVQRCFSIFVNVINESPSLNQTRGHFKVVLLKHVHKNGKAI